ncbi:MAG: hypothetical protein JJU28_10825 [Cyclobacteriaceae bacterium]|nr:hypothetical protein [Cyclobacteriaceae bacterium]
MILCRLIFLSIFIQGFLISACRNADDKVPAKNNIQSDAFATAVINLVHIRDETSGISWYRYPGYPANVNKNGFYLYFGRSDSGVLYSRLRIQYVLGDDADMQRLVISASGHEFTIQFDRRKVQSGVLGSIHYQWYDVNPDMEIVKILSVIAESSSVYIRIEGNRYNLKRQITDKEIEALKNMLIIGAQIGFF